MVAGVEDRREEDLPVAFACPAEELPLRLLKYSHLFWQHGEDLDEMRSFVLRAAIDLISNAHKIERMRIILSDIAVAEDSGDPQRLGETIELARREMLK